MIPHRVSPQRVLSSYKAGPCTFSSSPFLLSPRCRVSESPWFACSSSSESQHFLHTIQKEKARRAMIEWKVHFSSVGPEGWEILHVMTVKRKAPTPACSLRADSSAARKRGLAGGPAVGGLLPFRGLRLPTYTGHCAGGV